MNKGRITGAMGTALVIAVGVACSSSSNKSTGGPDASTEGGSSSCYGGLPPPVSDTISAEEGGGGTLQQFTCPSDPGPNAFLFSISGEVNAVVGYPYPPFDPTQTWMVDGWNWKIDKYIVVIDHITLWTNPNESASNQELHGPQIAHVDGPFVVDLHKGGPLDGKGGGGEEALAIAVIANQNDNGGAAFDPTQTYAFGFSTVPATWNAINVNLTSDEIDDYNYMVAHGNSVYYYGSANWTGNQAGVAGFGLCSTNPQTDYTNGQQTCASTTSAADGGEEDGGAGTCPNDYNFAALPQQMTFQLGFPTPTNYVNCVNYSASEQAGMTIRGVQTSAAQSETEQVTVHMDHPFWESFEEDTPVHWDDIAQVYIGQNDPVAHIEDFIGVPFDPFEDKNGDALPWHWCESSTYYSPPGNGAMSFSTLSVPVDPNGTCTGTIGQDFTMDQCPAIRDYYDYIRYTQSTQGHLNSQGLCYIDRQYPAPAGGS
jgi:hypothetical protein